MSYPLRSALGTTPSGKTRYFPGQAAPAIFSSLTRDPSNKNPGRPRSSVLLGTELPGVAAKGGMGGGWGSVGQGQASVELKATPGAQGCSEGLRGAWGAVPGMELE